MRTLHQKWLSDKATALSAAILAGTDLDSADSGERQRLVSATTFIAKNVTADSAVFLADSTLALLQQVPEAYRSEPDQELLPDAVPLSGPIATAHAESERRSGGGVRVPEILIAHAVYLLKQPHLSIRDFLKWLKRYKEKETREIAALLRGLEQDQRLSADIDRALDLSRNAEQQTRDRIDAVDRLYDALLPLAGPMQNMLWWLRICLALRTSLYCWPLMVAGSSTRGFHGISLPIGMFLSPNGKSKVYFKIVNPRGVAEHRPYVPATQEAAAHMKDSQLQWDEEWERAFHVGLHVAKTLWSTQNGRLRYVDETAADVMMNASVVVDVGPACAIVDAVYASAEGTPYPLSGRSAEAYWTQVILGMMLPGRELPLGVVTGRVELIDGMYELHPVNGIDKKLEYANNAGFSRVVLPFEYRVAEAATTANDVAVDDGDLSVSLGATVTPADHGVADGVQVAAGDADTSTAGSGGSEVQSFLRSLESANSRKRVEINFCRSVRTAADAMQMSGWRRTAFLRLPETQRSFSMHLRRLFLLEKVTLGERLTGKDRRDYERNPWTAKETRLVTKLDDFLMSDTRAIKFVDREVFEKIFKNGAEAEIGRWLAWKDHQVRGGGDVGVRGPGLGILCMRSTDNENEMRSWSAIADTLAASPEWWNRFQWSNVEQSAELLAQLLGNQRANPSISSTPAPDLLVLFDEARLSRRRTNQIFPDDFRGQWVDLLNPSKDNKNVAHPLNEALTRLGGGSLGTRIIVVYGEAPARGADLPDTLDDDDKEALARLSVFRFDFSKQAAYAMLNYQRPSHERLAWPVVEQRLKVLIEKRMLSSTRGRFYIEQQFLPALRDESPQFGDPYAHIHAAKSLAPILEPRDLFIASNRDRALEPESILEATWHLQRARVLVPARNLKVRTQASAALSTLTFLRPYPDWDTFKLLQRSPATLADAVELGRDLLKLERSTTQEPPHSSRVAALLNAIGKLGNSLDGHKADATRAQLADEATALCADVLETFEARTGRDWRRQNRKLFSEYVYCMRLLNVSNRDPRLNGALRYLEGTIDEVVKPDFFETSNLDDYPVSRDWLRARWNDAELSLPERSTTAYVAARLNIDRLREGVRVQPWDQPWIDYFALTTTKDFDARQLHSPLMTWEQVYGSDVESTEAFGQRVRDFVSYLPKKNEEISWWGSQIRSATDNLWDFINHPDPEKRLRTREAEIALRFIRIVTMYETLPAFDFIDRRPEEWLAHWPRRLNWSNEWNALAAQVIGGEPGWISMLASCGIIDDQTVTLVQSWLHAHCATGGLELYINDPEDLQQRPMVLADAYRQKRATAIWNGYQLLAKPGARGWAIFGDYRARFMHVLGDLDRNTNGWFLALANRRPSIASVVGLRLMLEHGVSKESIQAVAYNPDYRHLKKQLLWNIPGWYRYAGQKGRALLDDLGQRLTAPRYRKKARVKFNRIIDKKVVDAL